MKNLLFIFIIIFCSTFLLTQVNFELDFNFEKIDSTDYLTNLQLFDYNDDGIDEVVISYRSDFYNNYWRIICYSQTGSILEEFFQENNEDEFFLKGYLIKNNDITYLLTTFRYRSGGSYGEVYLRVKVFDFNTGSLICEQDHLIGIGQSGNTYVSYSITTSNIMHQILSANEIVFYIGTKRYKSTHATQIDDYTYRYKSMIYKFQLLNNNINFLEEIENAGEKIITYDSYDWIISTGNYYFHYWQEFEVISEKTKKYWINLLTYDLQSQTQEVFYTIGTYFNYWFEVLYENYPYHFEILTNNDMNFINYGLMAYYKEYDTDMGTTLYFINFSSDFVDSLWVKEDSFIGDNQITSSTCIPVNNEDHYVMYFRGDQLEIRDRIDGNIVHHQNSSISPFAIERKSDGALLFFVEQEDDTGYDVYNLDGEIQVSTDNNQLPTTSYQLQNYPNPFNPETEISFSIAGSENNMQKVSISVFNIRGQKVKTLVNETTEPGRYSVIWDSKDQNGKLCSSGIYFYKLEIDNKTIKSKKMLLLK